MSTDKSRCSKAPESPSSLSSNGSAHNKSDFSHRSDDWNDRVAVRDESIGDDVKSLVQSCLSTVVPVWPLRDYIAVNPFSGYSHLRFMDARAQMLRTSGEDILMPLEHYRTAYVNSEFTIDDIREAVCEVREESSRSIPSVEIIESYIHGNTEAADTASDSVSWLAPISVVVDRQDDSRWTEIITEEIGRFCGTFYDTGHAVWSNPWKGMPVYNAWKEFATINFSLLESPHFDFRRFVTDLPDEPHAAIKHLLLRLSIPASCQEDYLIAVTQSLPGWISWSKYLSRDNDGSGADNPSGLLAIRLAYDVAAGEIFGVRVNWASIYHIRRASRLSSGLQPDESAWVRYILLRASEIAYQRSLLSQVGEEFYTNLVPDQSDRPTAQFVFCIDVRSERIRRHIEQCSSAIQTFGFAGFFGVPMAFRELGENASQPHVPPLINPQFEVTERVSSSADSDNSVEIEKREIQKHSTNAWKKFSTSLYSCFGFVEAAGIWSGLAMMRRTLHRGLSQLFNSGDSEIRQQNATGPGKRLLPRQFLSDNLEECTEIAESILRGIGITEQFAPLVVLCGHKSSSENNPTKASLECGACCGHSGESNARVAADILNNSDVRRVLASRGIDIPWDTRFIGAVHDTTTDRIEFFDAISNSDLHVPQLEQVRHIVNEASCQCNLERMNTLSSDNADDLVLRSQDWSEIRPEWGLAGNAAFVIGPRSLTKNANLEGRAFLHSYNQHNDPDGTWLSQIMTAPMIVGHWISMQYYASVVNNKRYGSGSKTLHNVVGRFGILSGNNGDLTTGLPVESVMDGERVFHQPFRLTVVIDATRNRVGEIFNAHPDVANLVDNGWMHLVVRESSEFYRLTTQRTWASLAEDFTKSPQTKHESMSESATAS